MILSTTVKHFTLNATRTVMVIRKRIIRKEKSNGAYEFLALFDGSDEAKKALIEALKVADLEHDIVTCITFDTDGEMGKIGSIAEAVMKDAKLVHGRYVVIPCVGESVISSIEKYFTKEDTPAYDFVVLGAKGRSSRKRGEEQYLGSVAEKVITSVKTNLILAVKA